MLNVSCLSVSILNWGALAGQLAFVLDLGEEGATPLPPVDVLAKIADYPLKNIRHVRITGFVNEAPEEDIGPLCQALVARGFLVSVVLYGSATPAWAVRDLSLVYVLSSEDGSPLIPKASEVWYLSSDKEPYLHGLNCLRYVLSRRKEDILPWVKKTKGSWGFLRSVLFQSEILEVL